MKRKTKGKGLGSGRIYHVQGAREAHRNVLTMAKRVETAVARGSCATAIEVLTVAAMDYGTFLNEMKHGVGAHGRQGPAAAPRMRQTASNAITDARIAVMKGCAR